MHPAFKPCTIHPDALSLIICRRYLRGGFAERMLYIQILLAIVPPLWELLSPAQLMRSYVFSRYVRTQVTSQSKQLYSIFLSVYGLGILTHSRNHTLRACRHVTMSNPLQNTSFPHMACGWAPQWWRQFLAAQTVSSHPVFNPGQ